MITKLACTLIAAVAVFGLCGCGVGMQPEGSSVDQIKAKEAGMPPDQQISQWEHSPAPPQVKAQKIAEIKAKYNIK